MTTSCKSYLLAILFLAGMALHAQEPVSSGGSSKMVSLFEKSYSGFQQVSVDSTHPPMTLSNFKREVTFDSTRQFVTIEERLHDHQVRLPVTMRVEDFVRAALDYEADKLWHKSVETQLASQIAKQSDGIELNIPVRIRSKAFRRIFGGDRVGLRVSGSISFELAGRTESREGSAVSSIEERGNFSPKFKQTQQFRVEGRVGDKVTISVDQNSEATFDFENTLKLTYTGDEDEIVQKIEAGNVALSLPSTSYVSTSSNHQGLFGIKTEAQVGNFSFTGIASLQRGENEKLNVSGSSRENTFRIKDIDFVEDRFFFVDTFYRDGWEGTIDPNSWSLRIDPNRKIQQLDVWKSEIGTFNYDETYDGFAVLDPGQTLADLDAGTVTIDDLAASEQAGVIERGRFKRLEPDVDYQYDFQRGYLWLTSAPNDQEVVGIAYSYGESSSNTSEVGQLWQTIQDTSATIILRLIKPRQLQPDSPTWDLMMRNVYNLGGSGISAEGFDLKVLYAVEGDDQENDPATGARTYNNIMGLDRVDEQQQLIDKGDKKPDVTKNFVFDLANGYLFFPALKPFDPNPDGEFAFDPERFVDVYNTTDQTAITQQSKFEIEITTTAASSTFDLGFNVLEGSEKVKLNGRELVKDQDYIIDYFSGSLEITAPEARRADAQVEIEYERGALFQLDKKTLLGGRLEYEFGEKNFVGLTAMYFSKSTLDQRVRLGQEPIRNFIWDVNTAMHFKPNFLTTIFDKLPIVETSAESNFKIEAEYAQVNPNPNTFNEEDLGETDGVAYIDDFEGSKRFTSLGVQYRVWSTASAPRAFDRLSAPGFGFSDDDFPDAATYVTQMDANRVDFNWYNPFSQIDIRNIFPEKEVSTQTGTTTNVLNLRWRNDDVPVDSAWAGIMRSTASFADQKKTKFIEIWIKGEGAQVNVDIGRISEDWWVRGEFPDPNSPGNTIPSFGNLNSEDRNLNGLLDVGENEDTGIDGWADGDPQDDPNDNWRGPRDSDIPFADINGTENNSAAQGARYPDTEDLDGDGALNKFNDYLTYSFVPGDTMTEFFVDATRYSSDHGSFPNQLTGWRLYRIPLGDYASTVGSPDTTFQQVLFTRLWLNDIEPTGEMDSLQVAIFDFVGNEWEEEGYAESDDSPLAIDDEKFTITVANDEENTNYTSPPGVSGIKDRITKVESKEQSLVLKMFDLPGGARVEAKKQLRESINLINYKNLRMFVHGDSKLSESDSLWFYIRFGPTENIYYEYSQPVYPLWNEKNNIDIDFVELARTKNDSFLVENPDTLSTDELFFRADPNFPEKRFKVVGRPGLHKINYLVIGARNGAPHGNVRSRNNYGLTRLRDIEIWVDELRVTGVERESGSAMRLSTDLSVADIMSFRAQWEVIDDDFRRIEQQYASTNGKDQTQEKQSYFASLRLHKFLPSWLGVEIPIDGKYTRSTNIPKYFYNTDQRTNYEVAGTGNRVKQFFGMGEIPDTLQNQISFTESKSIGGTLKRQDKKRDPWYLRFTLNQLTIDADYSESHSTSPTTAFNDNNTLSGRLSYKIPFPRDKFIKPFGWMGDSKILKPISGQKFFYLPSQADFNFTMNDNETTQRNRLEPDSIETIPTISLKTTRKFTFKYKLTESVDFDFSRDYQSDGRLDTQGNPLDRRAQELVNDIFSTGDFGTDTRLTQRFGAGYTPQLWSWIQGSYRYSSNYSFSFDNPAISARSSSLNLDNTFSFDFKPATLVAAIYTPKQSSTPASRRRATRPGQRDTDEATEDDEPGEGDDGKKGRGFSIPNPAMWVWHFFNTFKTISFDIKNQDSYSDANLERQPVWQYQVGLQTDPEAGEDLTFNKLALPQNIRQNRTIDGSTQIDIARNVSASFRYNNQSTFNDVNEQRTQSKSNSMYFVSEDPDSNRQDWWSLVPDWNLNLSGVEKFPLFNLFATSATIQHARSGKFSESSRFETTIDEEGVETDSLIPEAVTYTNSYQPLIGLNISTKWDVSLTVRATRSITIDYRTAGATSKRVQSGLNISSSYSVTKGFKLPLPFMKDMKLDNEIQFSLAFDQTNSTNFSRSAFESEFQELDVNNTWKLRPSVTYRFSQKVNGSAFYEQSSSTNKRTGTTSYKEFGINVNIAIR